LVPHGGQSVLEPAAAGKPIVTGPHTRNFEAVVKEFLSRDAIVQTSGTAADDGRGSLESEFAKLLENPARRRELGENARAVMNANRGATSNTIEELKAFMADAGGKR
jgi:3-deoxy-D-manno-octulosonic-acid transferase